MQEIATGSLFIMVHPFQKKVPGTIYTKKTSFDGYLTSTTPNVSAGVYYSQQEKEYYAIIKHDNLCFTVQIMPCKYDFQ